MTVQVNIAEAKAKLSELVARAERGEDVVARHGKPIVTLTLNSPTKPKRPRRLGVWEHYGPLTDPDLFLRADPELEAAADGPIFPTE